MKEIYAIVYKKTKEIVTPKSFKQYWPNYGSNDLYGWRPAKKMYETLGQARRGFSFIPNLLKGDLDIAIFTFKEVVEDGSELSRKQAESKKKRELNKQKSQAKWAIKRAEQQLFEAQENLKKLKNG